MNTSKKFTLIFSASLAGDSSLTNLINSQRLALHLSCEVHVEYENAVGVYHGKAEQSFVVHTNSSSVIATIKSYVFEEFGQECILVSNNRSKRIFLHYPNGEAKTIGNTFKCTQGKPAKNDYTVLNGTDYYTVY